MTRRDALAWMCAASALPLGCRRPQPALRLANWGGAGDDSEFSRLVRSIYREFEQKHGVRLRVEGTPGSQDYVRKLLLDHIAGSMPDVVTLDASSAAAFVANRTLLDLSPFIERDKFDLGQFYPNTVDVARRDRQVFALPTDFTPMALYVNRRLLPRHVSLDGVWTFDDFLRAARDATTRDVYGFEFANWMPGWVMFLWNNGGDALSPDGDRASGFLDAAPSRDAVQFLADLVLKHKAAPDLSQAAATGVDYFATGRAAMKVVGHWYIPTLKASRDIKMDDVAVIPVPTNTGVSQTVIYESGNAIGAKCKNPALAWEFLKFFSSLSVQGRYNSSGIAVSARKDVEEAKTASLSRSFQAIVPSGRPPWGATVEGYDRVEDLGQTALDAVLKNGVPVSDALSRAADRIDQELANR